MRVLSNKNIKNYTGKEIVWFFEVLNERWEVFGGIATINSDGTITNIIGDDLSKMEMLPNGDFGFLNNRIGRLVGHIMVFEAEDFQNEVTDLGLMEICLNIIEGTSYEYLSEGLFEKMAGLPTFEFENGILSRFKEELVKIDGKWVKRSKNVVL